MPSRPADAGIRASPSPWRGNLVRALMIALAVGCVYLNTLSAPFVFDDLPSVVDNPSIRSLANVGRVLSPPSGEGVTVEGRPLVNLSLAVNYAFGGKSVGGYHALNIAIHIACALLLFGIVRRTLMLLRGSGSLPQARATALAVALLWALHPLQTESVTYVVQRAESQMALFYLATLYCFIRGAAAARSASWFSAALFFALAGMATKEVMVTVPVIVFLYDRTFVSGTFCAAWRRHRPLHLGLAATWVLLAVLVLRAGDRGGTIGAAAGVSPWEYGLSQSRALIHYLKLAAWPHPLIFDYGPDFVSFSQAAPFGILDLLLLGFTVAALRTAPPVGFVGAWFFLILAPTTSFVGGTRQMLAEHRMYLSLAAPVVFGVVGVRALLGRRTLVAGAGFAAALGLIAVARNSDYRDELVLYRDTVAKRPSNPFARYNLGKVLAERGRFAEAIIQDREAVRLRPGLASARNNLGKALADAGQIAEAIAEYQAAVRLAPNYAKAHYNLGLAWLALGRKAEARDEFQEAARLNPADVAARDNWGAVLLDAGDLDGAAEQFRLVLAADPMVAEAHCNLGTIYLVQGRFDDAIRELSRAIQLSPTLTIANERLAAARQKAGEGK